MANLKDIEFSHVTISSKIMLDKDKNLQLESFYSG